MSDRSHVHAWRTAAADPLIAGGLESLYADMAAEIAARSPVCSASGCCCDFERAGHRLYATGLETAYTLAKLGSLTLPPPAGPPGLLPLLGQTAAPPVLSRETLGDALARGTCPFMALNLCGVHPVRPLGCRVYFCDPTAQEWQMDLYERALARLRAMHSARGVPYLYGEWRVLLGMFLDHPATA